MIIINFKTGKPDILKVVFPIVHGGSDLARKKKMLPFPIVWKKLTELNKF